MDAQVKRKVGWHLEGSGRRNPCIHGVEVTLPVCGRVYQPGGSLRLILLGFLWKVYHISMINHSPLFQPLYFLKRMGGGADHSKHLTRA